MSSEKREIIGLITSIPKDSLYETRRQMIGAAAKNMDEPTLKLLACGLCKTHECENCALDHRVTFAEGDIITHKGEDE